MKDITDVDRLLSVYNKEINKDLAEIESDKKKFLKKINNGLGEKIDNLGLDKPKKTSFGSIIWNKIIKFLRYL